MYLMPDSLRLVQKLGHPVSAKKKDNNILLPYGFQCACNVRLQEVNPFYIHQAVIRPS